LLLVWLVATPTTVTRTSELNPDGAYLEHIRRLAFQKPGFWWTLQFFSKMPIRKKWYWFPGFLRAAKMVRH